MRLAQPHARSGKATWTLTCDSFTRIYLNAATAFSTLALFSLIYVVQSAGKVASVALLLALLVRQLAKIS